MSNTEAGGTALGMSAGLYKAVATAKFSIFGMLTFSILLDTLILALVGGAAGWVGTQIMEFIKIKYKKWKNDKSS